MKELWAIDATALKLAVRLKRIRFALSVRQAAEAARVAPSTIHRVDHESVVSAANVLALCKWTAIDPMGLLVAAGVSPDVPRETSPETPPETRADAAHEEDVT